MPTIRKNALVSGETYHIFTRSIAGYEVFRLPGSYERLAVTLGYYNQVTPLVRLSRFLEISPEAKTRIVEKQGVERLVQIVAYCIMPTHIHLLLKQVQDDGITMFMRNSLNSFTRYYNTFHKRRGPLWESEFKNVLVNTDEQLLHLSRYIHLNPVSAGLVDLPENWEYSSFKQYIGDNAEVRICDWHGLLDIEPGQYLQFVHSRIEYQRSLSAIKQLLIDGYTG